MKNYDFKLKMKTLWVWRDTVNWVCISCEAPQPIDPEDDVFGDRWRSCFYTISVCKKGISNFLSKLPKDPKELWQINPNGEVIVWEWTP